MDVVTLILFVIGFVLLIGGAEFLVRGASAISTTLGVSPLVVGLTVVSLGTSAPELAVSVNAAWQGQGDLALGNVVGSNVFNVLLILGLAAVIVPLRVRSGLVRRDVPVLIGVSLLVWAMGYSGGRLVRVEGLVLVGLLAAYTAVLLLEAKKDRRAAQAAAAEAGEVEALSAAVLARNLGLIVGGGLGLMLGSKFLVDGAIQLAGWIGVEERVIGLTVVAAGTSLPEIAASVSAAVKGEGDMAVGNAIGSNLYNLMAVLGITALIDPSGIEVPAASVFSDLPVMVVVAVACFPVFFTGGRINRWEGFVFLFYFVAFMAWTVLRAGDESQVPGLFSGVILYFAVPLTAITVVTGFVVSLNHRRRGWGPGEYKERRLEREFARKLADDGE